ncbi:ferredoxin [Rhodococcus pyridinivorans]|uniref:ferredoxin n=1 Tax=Rhodococcus pyridinivorans TaxID=103816 RepID=UPI000761BB5F|nr:ferredoxin [Rhodococcus pyridinivorans]
MREEQYVVDIDREICMGSGVCVSYAADVFVIGNDAKADVRQPVVTKSADVEVAVAVCPTGAITLALRSSDTDGVRAASPGHSEEKDCHDD